MPDNPMADFVDVIHERWWQSKTPPPPPAAQLNHHIGRDLSVIKEWLKRGYSRSDLLGALKLYEGNPITLLAIHKRGNLSTINSLVGEHKKAEEMKGTQVGAILRNMMANEGRI